MTQSTEKRVGIEKIRAYVSTQYLDLEELALARGHDPADVRDNLMQRTRSVNPLWEDPVTMTVNAAKPMLTDEDRDAIELVIVATESSVDQGKAMATYAQRFLGIKENCRLFEVKQACHAGTNAVMMAAHWVLSGIAGDAKALVICTDQSRAHFHKPYEFVMGAGAVAMLISSNPRVLRYEPHHNGYWAKEVADTFRPTSRVETGNGEESLYCYIDALEGSYAHFRSKAGDIDFDAYFKKNIYHVPFGGITFQAHRTMLRQWKRVKKGEAMEHFERKSKPALVYNSQTGSLYSGSTFMALIGLIDSSDDLHPGDRIGIFSYGSGSTGEYYSALIGPDARAIVAANEVQKALDARRRLTIAEYESIEAARFDRIDTGTFVPSLTEPKGLYEEHYAGKELLVLKGCKDHFLEYGWS